MPRNLRIGRRKQSGCINRRELCARQMRLEYRLNQEGRLCVREGSTQTSQFVVYSYNLGFARYYGQHLPPTVVSELDNLCNEVALNDHDRVLKILDLERGPATLWVGSVGVFPSIPAESEYLDSRRQGNKFVVVAKNHVVSAAWSARENDEAAELIVETDKPHRRRGYARQVATAWASAVMSSGRTAFYSHRESNSASRGLARSLKIAEFATVTAYG